MSGYNGFSKSNNAVIAECDGRFPASKAAKILGVPVKFLKECCGWANGGEWHHTSKFYNVVDYYNAELIRAWLDGQTEADNDELPERSGVAELATWKATQTKTGITVHAGCTVVWLEWGGTRNHPTCRNMKAEGCTVTDKGGSMVEVKLPGGKMMKKGKQTNGFEVTLANGKRL